jgi:hypothetical protein
VELHPIGARVREKRDVCCRREERRRERWGAENGGSGNWAFIPPML